MDLTNDDVQDILRLIDGLPFGELHLETARFKLSLRRTGSGEWTQETQVLTAPSTLPGPGGHGAATELAPASLEPATSGPEDGLADVRAPLLGTFYRAPRPGAEPFVQVGDAVTPDTVVAIVETMKLMNSVRAGTAGRVARISLENGDFAPLGATLMLIEPDQ